MITEDIQGLVASATISLYELDATSIGGTVLRWSNDVNELGNDIVWQGESYSRFPVDAQGFERAGSGRQPRPTLRVANITGLVGALTRELDDLIGSKLTRRRTFVKYLDAVNFSAGNPQADPNVFFTDEIWFIDRKSSENGAYIEFELASALDLSGVVLPRRQVIRNVCPWQYRSAECSYAGGAVADDSDTPTTDLSQDACGKRVDSCKLRFGEFGTLTFGGFAGVGRT